MFSRFARGRLGGAAGRFDRPAAVVVEPMEPRRLLSGTNWVPTHRLLADNPAGNDYFGLSVATANNLVLVGCPYSDGVAADTGAAYVFNAMTGQLLRKLVASDGSEGDNFGFSVAMSGNLALISAPNLLNDGDAAGAAYLFNVATGQELDKLTASDAQPGDWFGYSVAIDGTVGLVGAIGRDDQGEDSGAAYLFDLAAGREVRKLVAPDGSYMDHFGNAVALNRDHALIGVMDDDDRGQSSGSAYLFDAPSGRLLVKWLRQDGAAHDLFGCSVAIDGNRALVGSPGDSRILPGAGSVSVFDVSTLAQVDVMRSPEKQAGAYFGYSVAMDGDLAVIGSPFFDGVDTNSGTAWLMRVTNAEPLRMLTPTNLSATDEAGRAVALTSTRAVVGIPNADLGFADIGAAQIFRELLQLGDMNGDGLVNNQDIAPFVLALTNPNAYAEQYPNVPLLEVGDCNHDGLFNNQDIAPFVALLTGGRAVSPALRSLSLVSRPKSALLRSFAVGPALDLRDADGVFERS